MPPTYRSDFYIKIAGADVSREFNDDLFRAEVDANLYLPDMCTMHLHDDTLKWIDDAQIEIGKAIEVSVGSEGVENKPRIFTGEIAAIEARFSNELSSTTIIRAYDRAHRLHRKQKTRSWNNTKDSDIVSAIAGEHGLQADVAATTLMHPYVLCDNKTDFEFIAELARRNGFAFLVDNRTLKFKKLGTFGDGPTLKWGETLREFRPVLSVASQPGEIVVRGWDPKTKRAVVGQSSSSYLQASAGVGRGNELAQKAFGKASVTVADHPVATQAEADSLASGLITQLWSTDVKGEGIAFGNGNIRPGYSVTLQGLGTRFSGKYYVTSARHVIDADGYVTEFGIAGVSADTTADRITGGTAAAVTSHQNVTRGLAVAIVTNNQDPEKIGRVKLKFPWLDEATESTWAPVVSTDAGNDRGFLFIPEVNDEVLVGFLHGDANHPFVLGGLWNGQDKPPKADDAAQNGVVNLRVIRSRAGHTITISDKAGEEYIEIVTKGANSSIKMDSTNKLVQVDSAGDVKITTKGKVEIDAQGDLKMAGMNVSLEGKASLSLKAPQIDVKGDATVKISGGMVQIN